MRGLPFDDWQFYIVTAAFGCALWLIIRPLLPRKDAASGCPSCADGGSKRSRKTGLTVEGRRV